MRFRRDLEHRRVTLDDLKALPLANRPKLDWSRSPTPTELLALCSPGTTVVDRFSGFSYAFKDNKGKPVAPQTTMVSEIMGFYYVDELITCVDDARQGKTVYLRPWLHTLPLAAIVLPWACQRRMLCRVSMRHSIYRRPSTLRPPFVLDGDTYRKSLHLPHLTLTGPHWPHYAKSHTYSLRQRAEWHRATTIFLAALRANAKGMDQVW